MSDYQQQSWINADSEYQEHRALIRKNVSLLSTSKEDYPYVLIVNLVFQEHTATGLPSDESELQRLDATEEAIAGQMELLFKALFGLIVTCDGTRDLFFFFPEEPLDDAMESAIAKAEPTVDFDFSIHYDPEWIPYVELIESE